MKTIPINITVKVPYKILRGRAKKPERIFVSSPLAGEIKLIESFDEAPIALRMRTIDKPRGDLFERRVVQSGGKEVLVRPVQERAWEGITSPVADARRLLSDGMSHCLKVADPFWDWNCRVYDVLPLDTRAVVADHTEQAFARAQNAIDRIIGIEGHLYMQAQAPSLDICPPTKTGTSPGRIKVSEQADLAPGYFSHGYAFALDRMDEAMAFAARHGFHPPPVEFSSYRVDRPDLLARDESVPNAYMGVRTIEIDLQETLADLSAAGIEQLGRLLTYRDNMVEAGGGDAVWAIIDEIDDAIANRFYTPSLAPRIFDRVAKAADMTKDALSMSRDLPARPVVEFGDDPELANLGL